MSKNTFLVKKKENYFYDLEPQCRRAFRFRKRTISIAYKICSGLRTRTLPEFLFSKEVLASGRIIITDMAFDRRLYQTLARRIGPENVFLYYMNQITPFNDSFRQIVPQEQLYTFDPADAKHYGMKYKHLPYSDKVVLKQAAPLYDTFFLGIEKGRLNEIEKIVNLLEEYGLKPKVMLWDCVDPRYQMPCFIPYSEYLNHLAASKTILEINAEGQSSCTLRFLESLFLRKKLITNNAHIVEDPYYNPANVFLIGADDPGTLPDFVTQPYQESHQDLSGLLFENWIQDW